MINQNLIKTEFIVDNSGRNFDDGKIRRSTMFLLPLSMEDALKRCEAGKRVYFIYLNFLDNKAGRKVCRNAFYIEDHYDFYHDVCGVTISNNQLTESEYNVLNKLATASKMDCWFWLDKKGDKDYVRNLEENKDLSLVEVLPVFYEGLTNLDDYNLDSNEKKVAEMLFERFGCLKGEK